nr:uncharacterized protein LOC127328868 [Lolium perenne]
MNLGRYFRCAESLCRAESLCLASAVAASGARREPLLFFLAGHRRRLRARPFSGDGCPQRLPPPQVCERFPRIAADARGPCRKRDLDEVDPDPYVVWTKNKMGRTHTPRPDVPSASANPQVVERATPLQAETGDEFIEKLTSQGRKNKAPTPEAGSSGVPPAKRSRMEIGGKKVTSKHYRKREMPVASGPALKISKSATGMRPETSEDATRTSTPPQPSNTSTGRAAPEPSDHRAEENLASPPEAQDTGASNTGAGSEDVGQAEPQVPPVPKKKKKTPASSPSMSVPDSSEPASCAPAKEAPEAPAPTKIAPTPPPATSAGKPAPAKPTPPEGGKLSAQQLAAMVNAATPPSSGSQTLALHAGRAAVAAGETASTQVGRITELHRGGADLGHLLDYAVKWNHADLSPVTRGLGKDKLPAIDPAGPRSTGQHFGQLRCAVKEFDNAWHDANANVVVSSLPEASFEDLTAQLSALKAEKEQLISEHRQALDTQETINATLKDQLMQAELRHARELKEAQDAAEAKLDESSKELAGTGCLPQPPWRLAHRYGSSLHRQAPGPRLPVAEFAHVRTFIPPPPDIKDAISDNEGEDIEDEEDEEASEGDTHPEEGDAPPEAPEAGLQPPVA